MIPEEPWYLSFWERTPSGCIVIRIHIHRILQIREYIICNGYKTIYNKLGIGLNDLIDGCIQCIVSTLVIYDLCKVCMEHGDDDNDDYDPDNQKN